MRDSDRNGTGRLRSEINVTPLVDVALVLLIVFMVVTPLFENVHLELPAGQEPRVFSASRRQTRISLSFGPPHQIFLGDRRAPVGREELAREMAALYRMAPEERVVLRADRRLTYGEVKAVVAAVQEAGFHNLGLIAEKRTEP